MQIQVGTHISRNIVRYGVAQQTSHSCTPVKQAFSGTTLAVGPGTSRLYHRQMVESLPGQMAYDLSFIASMVLSREALFKANSCFCLFFKS
ncbi:hypothetical protein TNCV_3476771 [Trichonephila clavipes]|nr:hypothetical protein TNCV_3476771 [Trichonephila clavipes]